MQIEEEDRYKSRVVRTLIVTVTWVSIKPVEKVGSKQKGVQENKTENKKVIMNTRPNTNHAALEHNQKDR